jgi:probable HAF family extracellular repeat protein
MNALGQVVGSSETHTGIGHGLRTTPNQPIEPATEDLGTLGGQSSHAFGINNRGDVVGDAETADGESHAFLFTAGRMIDLNQIQAVQRPGVDRGGNPGRRREAAQPGRMTLENLA